MKVDQAVLLLSSQDGIPRARMKGKALNYHALFVGPAGLFLCDLQTTSNAEIFSAVAAREIEVEDFDRIDPAVADAITIEGNWPSRKVVIDGEAYAVPRNFGNSLVELLHRPRGKKRRR